MSVYEQQRKRVREHITNFNSEECDSNAKSSGQASSLLIKYPRKQHLDQQQCADQELEIDLNKD